MSRFKPGDLALIVSDRTDPDNMGRIVELIQVIHPGQVIRFPTGQRFVNFSNKDSRVPAWIVKGDGLKSTDDKDVILTMNIGAYPEPNLMPLRPDPPTEMQSEQLIVVEVGNG